MSVEAISLGAIRPAFTIPSIDSRVVRVALKALAQAALAVGAGLIAVTYFSASPIVFFASYFVAIKVARWAYLALSKKLSARENDELADQVGRSSRRYMGFLASPGFSGVFLHEAGHFIAIKALLKGARPRITIRPFKGGATHFALTGKMTVLGKIFGLNGSLTIIAAAGGAATVFSAMGQIALCEKIRDSLPAVKDLLLSHAITQLATEALYAMSAFMLKAEAAGHDFQMLWTCAGINPALPLSLIILLPTIEWLVLRYLLLPRERTILSYGSPSVSLSPA